MTASYVTKPTEECTAATHIQLHCTIRTDNQQLHRMRDVESYWSYIKSELARQLALEIMEHIPVRNTIDRYSTDSTIKVELFIGDKHGKKQG